MAYCVHDHRNEWLPKDNYQKFEVTFSNNTTHHQINSYKHLQSDSSLFNFFYFSNYLRINLNFSSLIKG